MAESTPLRDPTFTPADARTSSGALQGLGKKIKLVIVRSIFWSYERGSWHYDLIVLVILSFIFFTPRSWFQDRPTLQLTDLRHQQGFVELSRSKDGARYLIDARLVDMLAPEKAEDAIQQILRQRLQKPFTVKSIDVIRDRNKVILGYTVVVAE